MTRHISTWAPRPEQRAELDKAILDLWEAGASVPGIVAALSVFLGVELTPNQARTHIRRLGAPRRAIRGNGVGNFAAGTRR